MGPSYTFVGEKNPWTPHLALVGIITFSGLYSRPGQLGWLLLFLLGWAWFGGPNPKGLQSILCGLSCWALLADLNGPLKGCFVFPFHSAYLPINLEFKLGPSRPSSLDLAFFPWLSLHWEGSRTKSTQIVMGLISHIINQIQGIRSSSNS